jgi:hypothetical protein
MENKGKSDMQRTLASALSKKEEAVLKAMQTVYFQAKTDVANNKYQDTLEWLEFMSVAELANLASGKNCTYTSHHIMEDFQDSIAIVVSKGSTKGSGRVLSSQSL